MVGQRRKNARETRGSYSKTYGDGEDVVDHKDAAARSDAGRPRFAFATAYAPPPSGCAEITLRVREHENHEDRRDDDCERHGPAQRAAPGQDENHDHRLRPIGDPRQCVEAQRCEPTEHADLMTGIPTAARPAIQARVSACGTLAGHRSRPRGMKGHRNHHWYQRQRPPLMASISSS